LPMLEEAFSEFCKLDIFIQSFQSTDVADSWTYIWGSNSFSSKRAYNHLIGSHPVHPAIKWLWTLSCQLKHKVFFWLLLHNRLSTRGLLRRKNMYLESYTCELCLLHREENLRHLFFKCSFAINCWR
jgi:hypothetical protein